MRPDATSQMESSVLRRRRRVRTVLGRALPRVFFSEALESRTLLAVTPVGPETPVDVGNGLNADLAMNDAGNYVVAWNEYDNRYEVYARLYDAAGEPQGPAFRVRFKDQDPTWHATFPSVAIDDAGDFVIVAGDHEAYAQRYNADGTPSGQPFLTHTMQHGRTSDVAMDADGDFVVVWTNHEDASSTDGVFAQRYGSDGTRVGDVLQIDEQIEGRAGYRSSPAVAMDDAGAFTVTWAGQSADGNPNAIIARRFDAAGAPLGGEAVLSSAASRGYYNKVDVNASGEAVVTWTAEEGSSDTEQVFARRLSAAGLPVGDIILVNPSIDNQMSSDVAVDDTGHFLIGWQWRRPLPEPGMYGEPTWDEDVYVQRFAPDGSPDGAPVRVNTYRPHPQIEPVVVADPGGDAVVVYLSFRQDEAGGVYSQRYETLSGPTGGVVGSVWDDADADGIRDPGEGRVAGVEVNLYNEQGAIAGTTVTAADGSYGFSGLRLDAPYYAEIIAPSGRVLTQPDQGADDAIDSDFDPSSGKSALFTASETGVSDFDAGLIRQSTLGGVVFNDRDNDAQRDASEEGLAGWTVFLDTDADGRRDAGERFAITGADGRYSFPALNPGEFRVAVIPQLHWTTDPAGGVHVLNVGVGQDITGVDFANHTTVPETQVLPVGPPLEVATETEDFNESAVAVLAGGRHVVAWPRANSNDFDIVAQLFDAELRPIGEAFTVHSSSTNTQHQPTIAALPDGGFVVAWAGYGFLGEDPPDNTNGIDFFGIWARRFSADGVPVGEQFRIDTQIDYEEGSPSVAADSKGRFAIAWQSFGAEPGEVSRSSGFVRWYDAAAAPVTAPTPIASAVSTYEAAPQIGFSSDGKLTAVWDGVGSLFFRRFDELMQPLAPEKPLGFYGNDFSLGVAPSGDFLVAAHEERAGSYYQVIARRFAPDGTPQCEEFVVHAVGDERSDQSAAVAASTDGYVVTWRRQTSAKSTVYARRYSLAGVPLGTEFPLHDASLDGDIPSVAMDAAGGFFVGIPTLKVPEFIYAMFARRYVTAVNEAPAASVQPDLSVPLNAADPAVDLNLLFDDDQGDGSLRYTLVGNTYPALFTDLSLGVDGTLTLPLTDGLVNSSTLTVRATDAGGRFADTTFAVTVKPEVILSGDETYTLSSYVPLDLIELSGNSRLTLLQDVQAAFKTKGLVMSDDATLDIPSYGLIIEATPKTRDALLAAIHDRLGSARNAAEDRWTGPGITSSYLLSDEALPHTTLVAIVNPGHLTDANGDPLDENAIVITYAYNGDANLDGLVNSDDYFRIDSGFLAQPQDPRYVQGDFNYDGKVNSDDYFLIDSAFLAQPAPQAGNTPVKAETTSRRAAVEATSERRKRRSLRDVTPRDLLA